MEAFFELVNFFYFGFCKVFSAQESLVIYLSSNNSVPSIEVFTVHVHGASFALCNTSSPACDIRQASMRQLKKKFKKKENKKQFAFLK